MEAQRNGCIFGTMSIGNVVVDWREIGGKMEGNWRVMAVSLYLLLLHFLVQKENILSIKSHQSFSLRLQLDLKIYTYSMQCGVCVSNIVNLLQPSIQCDVDSVSIELFSTYFNMHKPNVLLIHCCPTELLSNHFKLH